MPGKPIDYDKLDAEFLTKPGSQVGSPQVISKPMNLDELDAQFGATEAAPSAGPEKGILNRVADYAPFAGAMIGGLAGVSGGGVGAIPGAGVGAMGGQAIKQLVDKWTGQMPADGDMLSDVANIARVGSEYGLGEGVGQLGNKAITVMGGPKIARKLYEAALGPSAKLAEKGVVDTGLREGVNLGGDVLAKIDKIKGPINDTIDNLVSKVHPSGSIDRIELQKRIFKEMHDRYTAGSDRLAGLSDAEFIRQLTSVMNKVSEYPERIPLTKARHMASYFQKGMETKYGELGSLAQEATKATARHARDLMEEEISKKLIGPGQVAPLKELNSRISKLIDFENAAEDMVNRRGTAGAIGAAVKRAGVGAAVGAGAGAAGGLSSTQYEGVSPGQRALIGGLVGAGLSSPRLLSGAALASKGMAGREILPTVVRIGASPFINKDIPGHVVDER